LVFGYTGMMLVLGGCGTSGDWLGSGASADRPAGIGVSPFSRARPVAAPVAAALDSSPNGARLDYAVSGRPVSFTLGSVYQSGLQVPCRIGRLNGGGGRSDTPTTYAFCRDGNQWYEMPPVVISGY
jgi:hypothetical protein